MIHLIEQSAAAAVLILFVVIARFFLLHKLPKITFQAMWAIVILRLLIPFSVSVPVQIPRLFSGILEWIGQKDAALQENMEFGNAAGNPFGSIEGEDWQPGGNDWQKRENWLTTGTGIHTQEGDGNRLAEPTKNMAGAVILAALSKWLGGSERNVLAIVWMLGAAFFLVSFAVAHFRCRKRYAAAVPLDSHVAEGIALPVDFCRKVELKVSDQILSPLTYGLFSPVILLPKGMSLADKAQLRMVLEHECVHILRFDILYKWLMVFAACLHWFNPFVWAMYALACRDMELSCDEAVVRRFESGRRQDYALALLDFEEQRALPPLFGRFSGNAVKERIEAIMRWKKTSITGIVLAVILLAGAVTVFATGRGKEKNPDNPPEQDVFGGSNDIAKQNAYEPLNPIEFRSFSVYSAPDGSERIYAKYPSYFDIEASSVRAEGLPAPIESGGFAIDQNVLYYVEGEVSWTENGEVADNQFRIMSCPLEAEKKEPVELLAVSDAAYLGEFIIRQGLLFCSYETVEGMPKGIMIDLKAGTMRDVHGVEEEGLLYPRVAFDSEWIYYRNSSELFRADYLGENISLVHEFLQPLQLLTVAGERFYAVCQEEEEIILMSMDFSGNTQKIYRGFQAIKNKEFSLLCQKDKIYLGYDRLIYQINEETGEVRLLLELSLENATIGDISLVEETERSLYCLAPYREDAEESGDNIVFLRVNLEDNAVEICGKWYMP